MIKERSVDEWLAAGGELKKNRRGIAYVELNGDIVAKHCTKCSEMIEIRGFDTHKTAFSGRNPVCKSCRSENSRKNYQKDREKALARDRKYREENRQKIQERNRKYREENREKIRERYAENREKILEQKRKYYKKNLEKMTERNRKYYAENRERVLEINRKYCESNQELVRKIKQRRRARKAALPDELTDEQRLEILDYFRYGCPFTDSTDIQMDHVIPLAIGHGGTIKGNMIPLRSDLNASKQDSNLFEWFEANKQRLQLSQERFDKLIEYLASANDMTIEEYRDYVYWCHANPRDLASETDDQAI